MLSARARVAASRLGVALPLAVALVASPVSASAQTVPAVPGACPTTADAATFASADRIESLVDRIGGFGLRLPASGAHNEMLRWLDGQLDAVPGLQVRDQPYRMARWQPTTTARSAPGLDLEAAGRLTSVGSGSPVAIPVAGAMPFSRPTGSRGPSGPVVYLPPDVPVTPANAKGKVVVRDVGSGAIPYAAIVALSHFLTPDLLPKATANYDRPFTVTGDTSDIEAAHLAGAVGYVQAFDVPRAQVAGYFDPHGGTRQHIPGVWVGVDEREQLKKLAASGQRVRIDVLAEWDQDVPTRNIIATLPGQSDEKIVVVTNTDGNTYVQENASASLLALAEYFARLPMTCRPKTIEFAFTSGHLAYAYDGIPLYAAELLEDPEKVSFAFVAEHLGTREILPVPRTNGPGQQLQFTGELEPYAWFAPTESPALAAALSGAITQRGSSASAVLRGLDLPEPGRIPAQCDFGGLANFFHGALIPAIGGISGPWSLWAPSFGKAAIDFDRMHTQTLVIADTLLALDDVPRAVIDGAYPADRAAVAAGAPTCDLTSVAKVAPGEPRPAASTPAPRPDRPGGSTPSQPTTAAGRLPATGPDGAPALLAVAALGLAALLTRRGRADLLRRH